MPKEYLEENKIFDEYGNYKFNTDYKQKGLNTILTIESSKDYEMLLEEYNLMKKEYEHDRKKIKALEIIKRQPEEVITIITNYDTFDEYADDYEEENFIMFIKNEEEFNLLKEVLN